MQRQLFTYQTTNPATGGAQISSVMIHPNGEASNPNLLVNNWYRSFGYPLGAYPRNDGKVILTYRKDRNGKRFYSVLNYTEHKTEDIYTLVDAWCFNNYADRAQEKVLELTDDN